MRRRSGRPPHRRPRRVLHLPGGARTPGAGGLHREPRPPGVGVDDDALTVRVTGVEHRTLVAFLSGTCLTCQRFWDAFQKPHKLGLPRDVRPVIVTKGPDQESAATVADLAPAKVPVVMANDAWVSYDVPGSPYFVLVDGRSGTVQGEGTGIDWPQVKGLLTQVTDDDSYAAELEGRRVAKYRADVERERRVDEELLAAGITPGDPSLFGPPVAHRPRRGPARRRARGPLASGPDGGARTRT